MRVEREMRLRAAGPHFCACVRSFRGCALRGARHEAPSLRLLCVIGLSRVSETKKSSARRQLARIGWLPWFNTHILYGATGTQHTFANAPKLARHALNTVRCAARRHPRGTSLLHARCASRAQLISGGRGTGARRGCRRPLGGPARSEAEGVLAAVSPGRSDGLLGGAVEVVAVKPARAEGRAGHPGARPQERALGIGSRAASAHMSQRMVVLVLRATASSMTPPNWHVM